MNRCAAQTPAGLPCRSVPMRGESWCWGHHPRVWRRRRHPLDYALDVLAARVEREFKERRRAA